MSDTPADRVANLLDHIRSIMIPDGYLFRMQTHNPDSTVQSSTELRIADLEALVADAREMAAHREALKLLGWVRPPF